MNVRGRDVLRGLIGEVDLDEFLETYWRKTYVRTSGTDDRFSTLFSWSQLSSAVELIHPESERLALLSQGATVDPGAFLDYERPRAPRISVPLLYGEVRKGATLRVTGIDSYCDTLKEVAGSL